MTLDQYILELQKLQEENKARNGTLLVVHYDSRYGFLPLGTPQVAAVDFVRGHVKSLDQPPTTVIIV